MLRHLTTFEKLHHLADEIELSVLGFDMARFATKDGKCGCMAAHTLVLFGGYSLAGVCDLPDIGEHHPVFYAAISLLGISEEDAISLFYSVGIGGDRGLAAQALRNLAAKYEM